MRTATVAALVGAVVALAMGRRCGRECERCDVDRLDVRGAVPRGGRVVTR